MKFTNRMCLVITVDGYRWFSVAPAVHSPGRSVLLASALSNLAMDRPVRDTGSQTPVTIADLHVFSIRM